MGLGTWLVNGLRCLFNFRCRLQRYPPDYVVLSISGPYPERPPHVPRRPFPLNLILPRLQPTTMEDLRERVERIGKDPRVRGAVLRIEDLEVGLTTVQALRRIVQDLRGGGKRVLAWLADADLPGYYLACAADEIVMPPSGTLRVLGLRSEVAFLRDTLSLVGVTADLEAIGEYKVSPNTFRRSEMTEPHRAMLEAILDDVYVDFVQAVAQGRELAPEQVRALVDRMPLSPEEAQQAGLIDALGYEDELPSYLHLDEPARPARLVTWNEARRMLQVPLRRRSARPVIGVVTVQGMITSGPSRRPPAPLPVPVPFVPEETAGAETIVGQLRAAERSKQVAAVILYVDSPGGSSLASDLIWRAVQQLNERKPVVVLMGGSAASGGYYVSAPARHIVAHPATLTGSIGIWGGKIVTRGLWDKIQANRAAVQRGASAGLYSDAAPFDEEERRQVRQELGRGYLLFKQRVADGRHMTLEQVEQVARGRVWTGQQALEAGLVDEMGDFETALVQAKSLAGLDAEREYAVVDVEPPRHAILPPTPEAETLAWAAVVRSLWIMSQERVWALAPWLVGLKW